MDAAGSAVGSSRFQYAFTELYSLSEGQHNIIAVVKFFKPPQKTAGSGFSMFASVSDPSLKGEKFGITFIQSPGDVVIIHRVKVSTFRGKLQGYSSEYSGSAAVVFPGDDSNPPSPYDSICKCSFSDEDLSRVTELKNWYNSPECPIEKEILPIPPKSTTNVDIHNLTRFHDMSPNAFFNTVAEVVGVYTYPEDKTTDIILCLWDGEPSTDSQNLPFFNHLDLERPPSMDRMTVDPHLVCVTGHSLHPPESDWSVCVFVFDEHAIAARNLKPGDLVRLHNVHCVLKYNPSRRKVDMHGGGKNYGRRIEVLTREDVSKEFLKRLEHGRLKRQSIYSCSSNPAEIITLPVTKISEIPLSPSHSTSSEEPSTLRVRVCGRIIDVGPSKPENIFQHLLLKCGNCSRSKLLTSSGDCQDCECGALSNPSVMPFFFISLQDVSKRLRVVVTTSAIRTLLGSKFDDFYSGLKAIPNEVDEGMRSRNAAKTLEIWTACVVGGWIDAVLTIQPNNNADLPILVVFDG
ncbi:unnamed protein product [Rodentolepis nana]|uniref:Protection of telomeres protein 1 n=1 Tax=Rodentolepis nana TaxID=102285 RepID=A0A0R3T482_RODNA|nr:unnamed protein product [Rodentolepis nana]